MESTRWRSRVSIQFAVGVLVAATAAGEPGEDLVLAVHISNRETASMVRQAVDGAVRRLKRPRCEGLLDRLADAQGRPLRASLEEAGVSARGYLSLLVFYDGSRRPSCRSEDAYAATAVGSRIVWICPTSFVRLGRRDPSTAQMVVIHEALHSLGLGENPPSSTEITAQVMSVC